MNDENENNNEIQDDYDYARSKYYNLAEKGDEAIDLMLDLARESEHPRAFEVLSNMLKQNRGCGSTDGTSKEEKGSPSH